MILGRYRVLAELGRGGMGVIHLAQASGPGGFEKLVALKELRAELATDDEHRRMFLEEARVAARLAHPNIVEVHDVGCHEGRWFMALELLQGCSLGRMRKHLGSRLPLHLSVRVLSEVLAALHHAHELGVVHRDVSPENVFVTFDGRVKLLDFGVAKARDRSQATKQGIVKGSVQYMSPDHVAAEAIDRRADVFAVGVLLREILSGEKLWPEDKGDLEIVRCLIAKDVPPFPARALATTSPILRSICAKATRASRDDRWSTAAEMKEALDAWLAVEDPRGSLAELAALLRKEMPDDVARVARILEDEAQAISLPPSDLVTAVSAKVSTVGARRRDRLVAGATVMAVLAAAITTLAWPANERPRTPTPTPRTAAPMIVRLDTTTRPAAPPVQASPAIDRFDPGY